MVSIYVSDKGKYFMKSNKVIYLIHELKFIRSPNDFKVLYEKLQSQMVIHTRAIEVPFSLQIEPTNYCNVRCLSCPRDRMTRPKGYMSLGVFTKIIDQAAALDIRRIELYLHGEPLLHPEIISMITYIKSKDIYFNLTTNGMLLGKEMSLAILQSSVNNGDCITISILGNSREVHERVMAGINHETVLRNISGFLELRNKSKVNGPVVQTVFYELPENLQEAREYMYQWRNRVDHAMYSTHTSRSFTQYKLNNQELPLRKRICTQVFNRMIVYWNGDVTMCCHDVDGDYVVGNLVNQSIRDVWNCKKMLHLRELSKERRFEEIFLCKRCDM